MIILTSENNQKRVSEEDAMEFLGVSKEKLDELIETGDSVSVGIRDYTVDELPEIKKEVEEETADAE